MKKRKYFDSVTKELREKIGGKTIAFDELMAMLVAAYDVGFDDGVGVAINEVRPMSERHSVEAYSEGTDAGIKQRKKMVASSGGVGKQRNNKEAIEKQEAFREVRKWWDKWQKDESLYDGVTCFDRAMLDKYDGVLTSQEYIARQRRKWEKESS